MFVYFCCLFIVRFSRGVNIYICIEMSRDTYNQPIRETLTFLYIFYLTVTKILEEFSSKKSKRTKKRKKNWCVIETTNEWKCHLFSKFALSFTVTGLLMKISRLFKWCFLFCWIWKILQVFFVWHIPLGFHSSSLFIRSFHPSFLPSPICMLKVIVPTKPLAK